MQCLTVNWKPCIFVVFFVSTWTFGRLSGLLLPPKMWSFASGSKAPDHFNKLNWKMSAFVGHMCNFHPATCKEHTFAYFCCGFAYFCSHFGRLKVCLLRPLSTALGWSRTFKFFLAKAKLRKARVLAVASPSSEPSGTLVDRQPTLEYEACYWLYLFCSLHQILIQHVVHGMPFTGGQEIPKQSQWS